MPVPMQESSPEEAEAMIRANEAAQAERRAIIHAWALEQADDVEVALEVVSDRSIEARQAIAFHAVTPKFYALEAYNKRRMMEQAKANSTKKASGETGAGNAPGAEMSRLQTQDSDKPAPAPKPTTADRIEAGLRLQEGADFHAEKGGGHVEVTDSMIEAEAQVLAAKRALPVEEPRKPEERKPGQSPHGPLEIRANVGTAWSRMHFTPYAGGNQLNVAKYLKKAGFEDLRFLKLDTPRQEVPETVPEEVVAILGALPRADQEALCEILGMWGELGRPKPERKNQGRRRY